MGFFSDILPIATTAAGVATGNPQLALGGLGMLAGSSAGQQAQQANQQVAQGLQFKPFGMTNTFGTSNFNYDPTTGQLTGANYSLSPFLSQYQGALTSPEAAQQNLSDLNSQLGLARSYLASSPQQLASNWMQGQQALLQPSRDKAWADVANKNFAGGTTGLQVAQGGSLAAANPYASSLANAQALQDLQLASQAQQQGQQQYDWGTGLLSSAYNPLKTSLATSQGIEQLGQNPYNMSTALGSQVASSAGAAAPYQYRASSYDPFSSILGGALSNPNISSSIGSLFSGFGGTPQGAYGQQDQYLAGALSNPQTQQAKMLAAQNSLFD